MADIYRDMIQKAVADMQRVQKTTYNGSVTVWAVPTFGNEPGQIVVLPDNEELDARFYNRPPGYMPRVIRPADNGASTFRYWFAVPYSAQFGILYEACRREPILPNVSATRSGEAA